MSIVSGQVNALRELAELQNIQYHKRIIKKAADTIEALSAKLAAANLERSDRYYEDLVSASKLLEELRLKEFSLEICRGAGDVDKTPKMVFMKDVEGIIDSLRS